MRFQIKILASCLLRASRRGGRVPPYRFYNERLAILTSPPCCLQYWDFVSMEVLERTVAVPRDSNMANIRPLSEAQKNKRRMLIGKINDLLQHLDLDSIEVGKWALILKDENLWCD